MVSAKPSKAVTPDIDWAKIDNLADARAALGTVVTASEILGDGSEFLANKDALVGYPFLVLDWRYLIDEKSGREYVNVLIMGSNGEKARFNDGSTGIYAQLKEVTERVGKVGIQVKNGLRRSDYVKEGVGDATTYYLST
jgi:hypothetical protein